MSVEQQPREGDAERPGEQRWPEDVRYGIEKGEEAQNEERTGCVAGWETIRMVC